jgi:NAD(P)H-hydrate epimerase
MKSVFTNKEILEAEKKIITSLGIPSVILMENAGKNSASFIFKYAQENLLNNVYILSGKGNNAGDGFVIARHLINIGLFVNVLLLFDPKELKGDSLTNFNIIRKYPENNLSVKNISGLSDFKKAVITSDNLFIDAVFGIGFKGELENRIKNIFKYINSSNRKKIISIDMVSGLDLNYNTSECLNANVTLSMGSKKISTLFGEGKLKSGEVKNVNIGVDSKEFDKFNTQKIFEVEFDDIKGHLPKRSPLAHKYNSGKVFIAAGSPGFTGAAFLSSLSSLRTGSGAVVLGIPESLNPIMEAKTTEVITFPLPETSENSIAGGAFDKIKEKISWADAVLLGPGIGRNHDTGNLIIRILKEIKSNYVIDADALFALKNNLDVLKKNKGKIILTPHYGEFSNLIGLSIPEIKKNLINISKSFAKKYGIILVLKNSPTIVTNGEYTFINSSGKENLATIGTGDVLSGIIVSLFSQSKNSLLSAIQGVYIHGRCGDELYGVHNVNSTIASDLIEKLPEIKLSLC